MKEEKDMMNLDLLGNPSIEKIVTAAWFDSLESLAIYSCIYNLTDIDGIGPKKAEEIKEVLEQHGLRTKLSNEEYFLINVLANENRSELIKQFWDSPMSDDQKDCLYDLLLSGLFEKENAVLKLYYGLDCERISLDEISQKYHLTRERIKQILGKAERKLKHLGMKRQLELLMVSRSELQSRLLATERELSVAKTIIEYYERKYGKTKPVDGPIEMLNLSNRTYRYLKRAGINTLEEARNADLTKLRDIGRHSIEEVTKKISSL